MAMPPTSAAAPMAPADDMPPADGAAPADSGMDEGAEPEVIATICVNKDGTYTLYAGDEPEDMGAEAAPPAGGEEAAPEGKNFDTPQALLRGVMELLNPTEGAEDSFGKGFRGEADDTASAPAAGAPMPG